MVVHENEVAFWRDDGAMGRASSEGRGDFLLTRAALDAYSDRIRTVKATTRPVLAIAAMTSPTISGQLLQYRNALVMPKPTTVKSAARVWSDRVV